MSCGDKGAYPREAHNSNGTPGITYKELLVAHALQGMIARDGIEADMQMAINLADRTIELMDNRQATHGKQY